MGKNVVFEMKMALYVTLLDNLKQKNIIKIRQVNTTLHSGRLKWKNSAITKVASKAQPISLSLKIQGRMAELAEGKRNYRQLLIKIFFEQLCKVDKNTIVAHYFDNFK